MLQLRRPHVKGVLDDGNILMLNILHPSGNSVITARTRPSPENLLAHFFVCLFVCLFVCKEEAINAVLLWVRNLILRRFV